MRVRSAPRAPAILALFLASGVSGLVYEVVWMRLLTLTLSVTVYAVTTVLCAFIAGLALGAAGGGRLADRVRRPLLAYGIVELGVGLTGIVTPTVLFRLAPACVWLHDVVGGRPLAFTLARFALAFGVLLVPCTHVCASLFAAVWLYSLTLSASQVARFSWSQQRAVAEWVKALVDSTAGRRGEPLRIAAPGWEIDYFHLRRAFHLVNLDLHLKADG